MEINDIVSRIKALQDAKKMSNHAFADVLNISAASLSHMYSGRNKPSLQIIIAITEQFSVSADFLIYGKETETPKETNPAPRASSSLFQEESLPKTKLPSELEITKSEESIEIKPQCNQEKKVTSIVMMYSDGTFSIYSPEA